MTASRPIRVLEVIQQGKIGGGESHLLTLLQHLPLSEVQPVVVALSDGEMMQRLQELGIKGYVVPSPYPFNPKIRGRMKEILIEEKIDLIHTHGARSLSNIYRPARQLHIPLVHTVHGWSFHDFMPAWKKKLRIWGEEFLCNKASVTINVSQSDKEIGETSFGLKRAVVVNNGIDLRLYQPGKGSGLRSEFNIPEEALVIGFIARFIHDKNPLPLLRAFARLKKSFPQLYLVMTGDGPARIETEQEAQRLGVSESTRFPGFRTDIPNLLGGMDIFCLPSIKEGLPVSLIEAMAMGAVPLATAVQGCTDVITHEKDGWLVPLADTENSLYHGLMTLLSDPGLRQRLSSEAIQTVQQRFDAVEMTLKIKEIYFQEIIKSKNDR